MKAEFSFALWLVFSLALHGQEAILIEAKFIEASPGLKLTKADCERKGGLSQREVEVLSRPRITTSSGVPAAVFIGETVPVVAGGETSLTNVQAGLELSIRPWVDGDTIKYTAHALSRRREQVEGAPGKERAEFSTREYYFADSCKSGESVFLSTRSVHDNRRFYIYLTLTTQMTAK